MSGRNPYIDTPAAEPPKKSYSIRFTGEEAGGEMTVKVDPEHLPSKHEGEPGSILQAALGAGIEIDHACGGVCACSTCHVIVEEGLDTCPPASDAEEDMLDLAPDLTPRSRLACQTIPNGEKNLVVRIPGWKRNLVRENH
ncbi:MAG: hypothetical protein GMKNLPBB_01464 [Myxococcota bacterium]|nr:hypothetical protein [Myxococcota bacterium]